MKASQLFLSILMSLCTSAYGQAHQAFVSLKSETQNFVDCGVISYDATLVFDIIYHSDSTYSADTLIATITCPADKEVSYEKGDHYILTLEVSEERKVPHIIRIQQPTNKGFIEALAAFHGKPLTPPSELRKESPGTSYYHVSQKTSDVRMHRIYPQIPTHVTNYPKRIHFSDSFPADSVGIRIHTDQYSIYKTKYHGMVMEVFNNADSTVYFESIDGRLRLSMQAIDSTGTWRDLQEPMFSSCYNSYYDVPLEPENYWKLAAPVYYGNYETQIRARLTLSFDPAKEVYSESIQGCINYNQFVLEKK